MKCGQTVSRVWYITNWIERVIVLGFENQFFFVHSRSVSFDGKRVVCFIHPLLAKIYFDNRTVAILARSLAYLHCEQAVRYMILQSMRFCYCKKQIDISFSCVCPIIHKEFRHNIIILVCRRKSWSITGQTHEKLTSIGEMELFLLHELKVLKLNITIKQENLTWQ